MDKKLAAIIEWSGLTVEQIRELVIPAPQVDGLALLTYAEAYKIWTDADDYDLHKAFEAVNTAQAKKQQAADQRDNHCFETCGFKNSLVAEAVRVADERWKTRLAEDVELAVKAERDWMLECCKDYANKSNASFKRKYGVDFDYADYPVQKALEVRMGKAQASPSGVSEADQVAIQEPLGFSEGASQASKG